MTLGRQAHREKPDLAQFSLRDVAEGKLFAAKGVAGLRSMRNGTAYTVLEKSHRIVKYSYRTGRRLGTILDVRRLRDKRVAKISAYEFSDDERRILLTTSVKPIYRHFSTALFYVWDRDSGNVMALSDNGRQQLARFAPDGRAVAFFRHNNLFVKTLPAGEEHAITTDGQRNAIINGAPDWVYGEELGVMTAFEWSPDSRRIAYCRFDERAVRQFGMNRYDGLYPANVTFKYPKAGEKNSEVTVHVFDLRSGATVTVDTGPVRDQYIFDLKWTERPRELSFLRLNRRQNRAELVLADAATGAAHVILTQTSPRYVDPPRPTYLDGGHHFIIASERSGYRHLYLHDMDGRLIRPITKGKWEVAGLVGCDAGKRQIYYHSTERSPLQRDLYVIGLDGRGKKRLTGQPGTNRASFSRGYRYFINEHSAADSPPRVTLHASNGRQIRILEDNAALRGNIERHRIPTRAFFNFTTPGGVELNGWLLKPADFDPARTYPLVMTVYGGPGSQTVTDSWGGVGWLEYLLQKGYLVASVDNRGTGGRGEDFRKCTYLRLGLLETEDQASAARHLGTLPFVDRSRIGIFGWSYGGFMACLCMFRAAAVFKAGIAVAPVTDWRYYDTVYTERFMRRPHDNPKGYRETSPLRQALKLQGRLLLAHGSADDNVHLQNTLALAKRLVAAARPFEMQIYPDLNHSIAGKRAREHLYRRMADFMLGAL